MAKPVAEQPSGKETGAARVYKMLRSEILTMTLAPGDVILTGTPEGVVNVNAGDEVICEIDGLGRLVNTIASDADFGRATTTE